MDAAVDHLGFGKQQILVLLPGGAAYAATSVVAVGVSQAARAIAIVESKKYYAGLLTSLVFAAYMIGNMLGGLFTDAHGRRMPLCIAFGGLTVFSALVAFTGESNMLMLATSFFGCGIFMGLGLSGANANMKEWAPARLRSNLFCMLFASLTCGQLAAGTFFSLTSTSLTPENLQWERLFQLQSLVLGAMFFFTACFLPESAHWLCHKGRLTEARNELIYAADRNGITLESEVIEDAVSGGKTEFEVDQYTRLVTPREDLAVGKSPNIFEGHLLQTTVIMCILNFMVNATYYGLVCTLPGTLSIAFKGSGIAAANVMLASMLFEIPGIALQYLLGHKLSRQVNLAAIFGAAAICLACLACSLSWISSDMCIVLSSLGCKLTIVASFIVTYLTMAEAYPTACQGTGSAFCMTCGRLGAVAAPLIYQEIGDGPFYAGLAMLSLFAGVLGHMLKL